MHDRNYGGSGMPDGLDAIARQYWDAWNAAMRTATGQPPPPATPWQAALDAWSTLARGGLPNQGFGHGGFVPHGMPGADDLISRLQSQAGPWFGQMQQLAAQFSGGNAGAGDIARAWRQMLGASGGNPFAEMMSTMRGQGAQGFERWLAEVTPMLEAWRGEGASWTRMPAFGLAREHQERAQRLAEAFGGYQQRTQDYNALMAKATENAFAVFERKLGERGENNKPIETARALFDLWIDAAEDAYAEIALSPEFRAAYGQLVDAQMRLRGGIQREVEQVCAAFGMPTRSELDGAHRKIVELERQMRRLRTNGAQAAPAAAPARTAAATPSPKRTGAPKAKAAPEPAKPRAPAKRAAAKRAPVKQKASRANAPRSQRRGPAFAIPDAPVPLAPEPMTARTTSARKR